MSCGVRTLSKFVFTSIMNKIIFVLFNCFQYLTMECNEITTPIEDTSSRTDNLELLNTPEGIIISERNVEDIQDGEEIHIGGMVNEKIGMLHSSSGRSGELDFESSSEKSGSLDRNDDRSEDYQMVEHISSKMADDYETQIENPEITLSLKSPEVPSEISERHGEESLQVNTESPLSRANEESNINNQQIEDRTEGRANIETIEKEIITSELRVAESDRSSVPVETKTDDFSETRADNSFSDIDKSGKLVEIEESNTEDLTLKSAAEESSVDDEMISFKEGDIDLERKAEDFSEASVPELESKNDEISALDITDRYSNLESKNVENFASELSSIEVIASERATSPDIPSDIEPKYENVAAVAVSEVTVAPLPNMNPFNNLNQFDSNNGLKLENHLSDHNRLLFTPPIASMSPPITVTANKKIFNQEYFPKLFKGPYTREDARMVDIQWQGPRQKPIFLNLNQDYMQSRPSKNIGVQSQQLCQEPFLKGVRRQDQQNFDSKMTLQREKVIHGDRQLLNQIQSNNHPFNPFPDNKILGYTNEKPRNDFQFYYNQDKDDKRSKNLKSSQFQAYKRINSEIGNKQLEYLSNEGFVRPYNSRLNGLTQYEAAKNYGTNSNLNTLFHKLTEASADPGLSKKKLQNFKSTEIHTNPY